MSKGGKIGIRVPFVHDTSSLRSSSLTGKYHISTYPDFITYNEVKLLNHRNYQIREIAEQLL